MTKKPPKVTGPVDVTVEAVFNVFDILKQYHADQAFLDSCKQNKFTLVASPELINFTKGFFQKMSQGKVHGPDCPNCPY